MSKHDQTIYDASPLNARRLTTFFSSVVVALGSGTSYAFSVYAPQLGSRLKINHTQLNIIGIAKSSGAYSTGPFWGWLIDSQGPRPPLASAFLNFLIGYSGIRFVYDKGLSPDEGTASTITFLFLVLCAYLCGAAGISGMLTAVNSTAKTFPDRMRATTVGLVLSGTGLSAFFFSNLAQIIFPGDTSRFLLVLLLGTTLPMALGFFLVRPVPLPEPSPRPASLEAQDESRQTSISEERRTVGAGTPLLQHDNLREGGSTFPAVENAVEGEMSGDERQQLRSRSRYISRRSALLMGDATLTNMFGKRLIRSVDFWLLFAIFSFLSGTGFMYINNVGLMSQALYANENPTYDDVGAQRWQTAQVSAISVMNFTGRMVIGFVSDHCKNRFGTPRSTFLVLVSFLFFLSQTAAASIGSVKSLWVASSLLGLAYGSAFSLFATICAEWFGMFHYGMNWGSFSPAPLIAGNVFSLMFGRNLDAHGSPAGLSLSEGNGPPRCLLGRGCYADALYPTAGGCLFALVLSLWACWRDRQMMREAAAVNAE